MTRLFFLFFLVTLTQGEQGGSRSDFRGCNTGTTYTNCAKAQINVGEETQCVCKANCRRFNQKCQSKGRLSWTPDEFHCSLSATYRNQDIEYFVTPAAGVGQLHKGKVSYANHLFTVYCDEDADTIQTGSASCNLHGDMSVTIPPICVKNCTRSIPENIQCPDNWIWAGETKICRCKYGCRSISLHCHEDGYLQFDSLNSNNCAARFETITMETINAGRVNISYTNGDFKVNCDAGETVRVGEASCTDAGELKVTAAPVCDCTKPTDSHLQCDKTTVRSGENLNCFCKLNCRGIALKCLSTGVLDRENINYCTERFTSSYLIPGRKLSITYENGYFKEQCTGGETRVLSSALCDERGNFNVSAFPLCGCTTKPPNYLTCEQNKTRHGESINCNCTATCRPVTLTCDTDGAWTDVSQLCDEPIDRRSDNVVSTFNNGKYNFECVEGHQPISGSHVAVCENGQLNVTKESQLRCQPAAESFFPDTRLHDLNSTSSTSPSNGNNNLLIYIIAILGCICSVVFIYFVYKFIKKRINQNQINRHSTVEVEEVYYDEIDLSKAVPDPDPDPELPPRVREVLGNVPEVPPHEVPGYLGVMEAYQYDVGSDPKPLQAWIKVGAGGDGRILDDEGYEMPVSRRNQAQSSE